MKTLIIYAHPDVKGHCSLILDEVLAYHKKKNITYELIDLYKINYDPVLHENELYSAGRRDVSEQTKEFQQKISDTNKLIFIYPIWWSSMPAILKGFFDKVFVSRFAFRYVHGIPVKMLTGKKAAVFMTSGTFSIFTWLIQGNRARNLVKRDILGFFGIRAKVYQIDNCIELPEKQANTIKRTVKRGLNRLY
ncbi:flavodoxin family protein [Candidatus Woesearchaeota archaeon]|nr:MAG: flavodoxin family protein [Candidatus Woesearchaeota archaeon]